MLPVDTILDYILGILCLKKVLILVGETGSGKTLRIPQLAYFLGLSYKNKILCTEPKRIAVCSAAKEVSEKIKCKLSSTVGYAIRFQDNTSPRTKIKFITEGLFIKEILADPSLKKYSILIIDEVHERSSNTDIILSLIKNQIMSKLNIRVILMSATIEAEKFSNFFFNCPVLCIPGRNFNLRSYFSRFTLEDFIFNVTKVVFKIVKTTPKGNILIFLKGRDDIDKLGHIFFSLKDSINFPSKYEIFPIFSEISTKEQLDLLMEFSKCRKIILATNIAEASITIPGIHFVIDTGLSKINFFDLKWNQEKLSTFLINKLSIFQRTGRTGRTDGGRCYRLYTKWSFKNELKESYFPEIQRIDLCGVILFFKSVGFRNLFNINWLDNPSKILLFIGLKSLYLLGALNKKTNLTILGRKITELPLKPMLGKSLLLSERFNCKNEILYLSCMLSISSFRLNFDGSEKCNKTSEFKKSDHLTYSTLFKNWKKSGYSREWCNTNKLNFIEFGLARNIEIQLKSILNKLMIVRKTSNIKQPAKALIGGFFLNIAKLVKYGFYKLVFSRSNSTLLIHKGSILNTLSLKPNFILFDHLLINQKFFVQIVSVIKLDNLKTFLNLH